jgi:GAF domain-containing protein
MKTFFRSRECSNVKTPRLACPGSDLQPDCPIYTQVLGSGGLREDPAYTEDEIEFLTLVAGQVAIAVDQAATGWK